VGKNARVFRLLKFRSMHKHADKLGTLTVGMKDSRISKVGFFLRKYKLDEFPQFINVLKGEMSIVGPRPEVKEYVDLYTDEQRKILNVRPGITDYASIEYFKENEILGKSSNPKQTYIEVVMPEKIALNQKYLHNPSLLHDFKIIGLTLKKVLLH
jgi:lipopolysaccharide/colanic/teichoic acid biosynthesis glycosyltransferase